MAEQQFHPCGRKVEIAARNNKANGWKRGDVKPCLCLLCGPVEDRIRKWVYWSQNRHYGYYLCVGVPNATVGCDEVRLCAGPSAEHMICRECFELPPLIHRPAEDRLVRRKT